MSVAPEVFRFEGLTLDLGGRALLDGDGRDLRLTRSEFDLLTGLVRAPGRALSREFLLEMVAGRRGEPFDRSIDVLIGRLRKKVEPDPKSPRLIVTVAGSGYKFAAKLQPVQDDGRSALVEAETDRQRRPHAPERRQLTILLCRLATPLFGQLDPEDLYHVIRAFRRRATDVCAQCGGVVAQVSNDAILAYFGYPQAHEHDAERAVRAGLAMIETGRKLDSGLPDPPAVRVSIATGNVVVGDLLDDDAAAVHAVVGEAPDLAARLLPATASGSVLIATSTKRLIGRLFDCRPLGRLVQDAGVPAEAFQVLGEASVESRFEALRQDRLTRLVGREEELARLLRRWARAREGAGRLVQIGGEPGIGKSRLVRELRARINHEAHRAIVCFCAPHHQSTSLHPIIAHLERAASFARDDAADEKLAKLEVLLGASDTSEGDLALIADLLAIPCGRFDVVDDLLPRQRRLQTLQALIAQLLRTACGQPLLLVFEDLHWIDPTSRELLEALVDRIGEQRILIVVTSRPEFCPTWSSLVSAEMVPLRRLDDAETAELVADIGRERLPDVLCRRIVKQADGVPLFAEELARVAVERSSARDLAGEAAPGGVEPDLPLPASLHDSLMARLDRVPAVKQVAQLGAVIGRSFSHQLIAAVASWPEPMASRALDELVSSGLATRRGEVPDAIYTFKHALVQNAAYESLLRSRRATIHARIVDVLLRQEPQIERADPALLAHHCEQGGLVERAIDYYARAARSSGKRGAVAEAREHFASTLRLIATLPAGARRDRMELHHLVALCDLVGFQQGYSTSEFVELNCRSQQLWERLGRPSAAADAAFSEFIDLMHRSEIPKLLDKAEALLRLSCGPGDARGRIVGHHFVGAAAMLRGELARARLNLEEVIRLREPRMGDASDTWDPERSYIVPMHFCISANTWLAFVQCWRGFPEHALAHSSAAVEEARCLGDFIDVVEALTKRAELLSFLGDVAELEGLVRELTELTRKHGFTFFGARVTIMNGYLAARRGDLSEGRALIGEGMAGWAATGARLWTSRQLALLAEANRALGETDEALRLLNQAVEHTKCTGEIWYATELHRHIGETHRQRGDNRLAYLNFQEALASARSQNAKLWELQAATSCAGLLCDQGRSAEARVLLAPVHDWFTEGLDTNPVRDARALLESLARNGQRS